MTGGHWSYCDDDECVQVLKNLII
uniref:Alpha/beta hydrolase n=1 Tax=Heterorhabditis bacteriophora TaxID=37862 RepID=A0A1I7XC67_HETBA